MKLMLATDDAAKREAVRQWMSDPCGPDSTVSPRACEANEQIDLTPRHVELTRGHVGAIDLLDSPSVHEWIGRVGGWYLVGVGQRV